jgi:hypothetical protein
MIFDVSVHVQCNTAMIFDVSVRACMHKILFQHATGGMIHQNLIPVCIRGLPVCVRGGGPEILHMGSPCSHNEIVRILGATYTPPPLHG